MRAQDLIEKKRERGALTRDEIAFLIRGYTRYEIPDYQMAAFLMAAFLNGMSEAETTALLEEMLHSGVILQHDEIPAPKVDKHSTGGVGDKTSLVIAPIAAACGLCVPMISGRALAHTGGTLDKLEAIHGFRTNLSLDEFRAVLKQCGLAFIGQTKEIAPADRKIYALRDLTATVPFRPFIVASILSKKLAEGIDGLVLEYEDAKELAQMLVKASRAMGKRTVALLTNMNQPLGRWVGNYVETLEAIRTLRGDLTSDFAELCLELAAQMLLVGNITADLELARQRAKQAITSGAALKKFRDVIKAQGGDYLVCDNPDNSFFPVDVREIKATQTGFVSHIQTDEVGRVVMDWGGGRKRLEDPIDYSVGLYLNAKLGDRVQVGDPLITAYFEDETKLAEMTARLQAAYQISEKAPTVEPLIKDIL
jgi:pyrimidine-nucleoside phosphorylase